MGLQEQLLSEQVGLLFVSGHTCVENDLTTAGFFFLIDEVALDAAWVKETLVAWSPDRDIIRPSTEDGLETPRASETLPILLWLPYMAF